MESCIYEGVVRHRRFQPVENAFTYTLFMVYLDLAELESAFRGRWFWSTKGPNLSWLRRSDHLKHTDQPWDKAVRDLVEERTGVRPVGRIGILTHLRTLGFCFNPVSFYYCWSAAGDRVETIVAEVNNTPWLEQHCYVLDESRNEADAPARHRYRFGKDFHVSPFMPMDVRYDWRFTDPADQMAIQMENYRAGAVFFDATLTMKRTPISGWNLARALASYPPMTMKVVALIYWQALRLWWKGVPFHAHPAKTVPPGEVPTP